MSFDFATQQTAAGFPKVKEMNSSFVFAGTEIECLRKLASEVAEIAAQPIQKKKAELWTAHNDLKTTQPLVFIDPENGWNECIPADSLICSDPLARVWEMYLRKQIMWHTHMKDDRVIDNFFDVPFSYSDTGWGVKIVKEGGDHGGAYKLKSAIEEYEDDFEKVRYPIPVIDFEESAKIMELAQNVFDGILNVRRKTTWWWTLGMTWDFINLRGYDEFLCDFIVEGEWIHRLMNLLCEGQHKMLDYLEKNDALALNTGNTYVGSGGFGYTQDLPGNKEHVTTMDMWGFVESQETSGVSPEMYGEFILPYHIKMAERFGLNCYGCCEPTDPRWEYVKQIPRLRRVSYSPWAKWDSAPELLGKNYITSLKPSPTPLAGSNMDEDAVRADLKRAVSQTKDCVVEIIMKDNNTLGGSIKNATRWVEIAREEIDKG